VPEAEKPRLDPLLAVLQQLRLRVLMAAAVAVDFHRRRVMPLCRRRLRLDQMTSEASLEGTRMSHESLALKEVLR
jgi:diphthamide synthase (EF-2-diphthine--ammonia ligase)